MKVPIKQPLSSSKLASLEKLQEREVWHKLVIKIISWKELRSVDNASKVTEKITPTEWDTYYKRMVDINTTYSKQKVLSDLKNTQDLIEEHGGFDI